MKAKKLTKETIREIGMVQRNFDPFRIGDTVIVSQRIKEGDKERIQQFEGDVICIRNNGISTSFIVRRIGANSIPVERTFPYYSPKIETVKFVRSGKVRRAKLFFMRHRIGKAARVQEKIVSREQREQSRLEAKEAQKQRAI
jgi:large subunit ribosomal protein L19